MTKIIQWSNQADRGNGYGHTRNEEGEPVRADIGYRIQAMRVLDNPEQYSEADIIKAENVIRAASKFR